MATDKVKIGLLGCGRWGSNILRDLLRLGASVAVVDPAPQARQRAVAAGADKAVADLAELDTVDGLIVATPATTHAEHVERALGRGKPVFVEKPLTTDVASAERLATLAPERLFVMHIWRYHRGIELLATIAQSQELGPVHLLRSTRTNWTSPRRDTDAVWTLAPHDLSIAIAVLGALPAPRFATMERHEGKVVGMIGVLGDGPVVVLEVSTRSPDKKREVRLHCRDGVAILPDGDSTSLHIARPNPSDELGPPLVEQRSFAAEPPLLRELATFVAFLRGGPPPPSSAAEGLAVVAAIAQLRALAEA